MTLKVRGDLIAQWLPVVVEGTAMRKKNPLMSLWLSGANKAMGTLRGHAIAQAKRQTATATTKATKDILAVWAGLDKGKKKRR
jgi:hypothetical protein